jgi:hypothetical protein
MAEQDSTLAPHTADVLLHNTNPSWKIKELQISNEKNYAPYD